MSPPRRLPLAFALPALAATVAAGAARAGGDRRPGAIRRVEKPPVEQVRVEGGWFVMGVPASDVPVLIEECTQVSNIVFAKSAPPSPGGPPLPPTETELCTEWSELLGKRGPRSVWVDGFTVDRTEVTQGGYRACVHADRCSPVPLTSVAREHMGDDRPVTWITRDEAEAYCRWRGGRLPTEAEWEKAARGTDGRTWPWGDSGRVDDFNHGKPRDAVLREADRLYPNERGLHLLGDPDDRDGHAYAAPVGALRWSRGPYGAVDQAGNVAEWVADDWSVQGYDGLPMANPLRLVDGVAAAITRGGSWRDPRFVGRADLPSYVSALPLGSGLAAADRALHVGFRCVRGGAVPDSAAATPPPGP